MTDGSEKQRVVGVDLKAIYFDVCKKSANDTFLHCITSEYRRVWVTRSRWGRACDGGWWRRTRGRPSRPPSCWRSSLRGMSPSSSGPRPPDQRGRSPTSWWETMSKLLSNRIFWSRDQSELLNVTKLFRANGLGNIIMKLRLSVHAIQKSERTFWLPL